MMRKKRQSREEHQKFKAWTVRSEPAIRDLLDHIARQLAEDMSD
jgi:hypothetical protein